MAYVDFYVLAVRRDALDAYFRIARDSAALWLENGALSVVETRGEDTPYGTLTSFPRAVMATEDEVMVVGYVTFQDRAHRDAVNARAMADTRMMDAMEQAPVDGKRMIWGGFEVVIAT